MNREGQEDRDYWNERDSMSFDNCDDCDADLREDEEGPNCDWCTPDSEDEE